MLPSKRVCDKSRRGQGAASTEGLLSQVRGVMRISQKPNLYSNDGKMALLAWTESFAFRPTALLSLPELVRFFPPKLFALSV